MKSSETESIASNVFFVTFLFLFIVQSENRKRHLCALVVSLKPRPRLDPKAKPYPIRSQLATYFLLKFPIGEYLWVSRCLKFAVSRRKCYL